MMHGHEKSRSAIVAVKPTNKAERSAAESVERRAETKGNVDQQRTRRTQRRISVSQMLARIRQHIVAVDTQGGNRMRESCTYGFCEPTTIPPLRVLLVPAASARPGLGPGDKPVHLAFGLCLALLFRTVRGCLKEGVDRSTVAEGCPARRSSIPRKCKQKAAGQLGARSSKNSKANRIETGERSGGIRRNLFGGSRRKIAKKIANHRPS